MKAFYLIAGLLLAQSASAASNNLFLSVRLTANSLGHQEFTDENIMYCTNADGRLILGATFGGISQSPEIFLVDSFGNAESVQLTRVGALSDQASDVPAQDANIFGFYDAHRNFGELVMLEPESKRSETRESSASLDGQAAQCFGRLFY